MKKKSTRPDIERSARVLVPTLAVGKFSEEDHLPLISRKTLRLWYMEAGVWRRHRRRRLYRKRSEPKHHFGELVQPNRSPHGWFGQEPNSCCLMIMVDDATGISLVTINELEITEAAMPHSMGLDRRKVF